MSRRLPSPGKRHGSRLVGPHGQGTCGHVAGPGAPFVRGRERRWRRRPGVRQ